MKLPLMLWFWVAVCSGLALVALFFLAHHAFLVKEEFFSGTKNPLLRAPPDSTDIAARYQHKKRTFRSFNLFYALAKAYVSSS